MSKLAAIFGCAGFVVSAWEKQFFAQVQPAGFILFARNIDTPDQLTRLTSELRSCVGWDAPILIDQEGGRVQRMRAPYWREYLPALEQMERAKDPMRAQYLRYRLIAHELYSVGVDVNCAPLADLVEDQTHPVLLNRLYGSQVDTVIRAAQACADALLDGGVLPVLKHLPGYGRAVADSHHGLSRVSASREELYARDFAPFKALSHLKMGMSAHLVFDEIDRENPATTSADVIELIRNDLEFSGLLMSDDISMNALQGDIALRTRQTLQAGCDIVLHCNAHLDEMQSVAESSGVLSELAQQRLLDALSERKAPLDLDVVACERELAALLV